MIVGLFLKKNASGMIISDELYLLPQYRGSRVKVVMLPAAGHKQQTRTHAHNHAHKHPPTRRQEGLSAAHSQANLNQSEGKLS